jgi:hypothetical protein
MVRNGAGSDRMVTVFVPITVAALALVGVIVTAVLSNRAGGDSDPWIKNGQSPSPEPTVQVLTWSSRQIDGGTRLLLVFEGVSANIPRNHSIFVLARLMAISPATTEAAELPFSDAGSYQVSPPADIDDTGNWRVEWRLQTVPQSVGYEVVVARLVEESDSNGPSAVPTHTEPTGPPSIIVNELEREGPDSNLVVARDPVDTPPSP